MRSAPRSKKVAFLHLCRIGNVFTALADILMGYAVTRGAAPWGVAVCWLLVATAALYTAGMVLNDWFDVEQDRVERPHRPIPAGEIDRATAGWLGVALLIMGVVAAALASLLVAGNATPLAVSVVLVGLIVAYDGWLKRTWLGPPAMGACRGANVLLGMSLVAGAPGAWTTGHWLIAAGMAVYVSGITWLAKGEATGGNRLRPLCGTILMMAGVGLLAAVYSYMRPIQPLQLPNELSWWCLLVLVAFPVIRRAIAAVIDPAPRRIQQTVGLAILTLIVLDASLALLMGGTLPAIVTIAMLVPALVITRWIPPT